MKPSSDCAALEPFAERPRLNGIESDPRAVAAALLGLVRVNGWTEHLDSVVAWLLQLALDVAK